MQERWFGAYSRTLEIGGVCQSPFQDSNGCESRLMEQTSLGKKTFLFCKKQRVMRIVSLPMKRFYRNGEFIK